MKDLHGGLYSNEDSQRNVSSTNSLLRTVYFHDGRGANPEGTSALRLLGFFFSFYISRVLGPGQGWSLMEAASNYLDDSSHWSGGGVFGLAMVCT